MLRKKTARSKAANNNVTIPFFKRINGVVLWLAATGILAAIVNLTFDFLTGDVQVQYIQPSGRGYEFKLINKSSTDQVVEGFRIAPDFNQKFVFKIKDHVYGKFTDSGVSIPGGSTTYMPAYEYSEMNGYILQAKSEVNFRIPPLVARRYMAPESIVVFAEYSTKSSNEYIAKFESFLTKLKLRDGKKRKKYLVADNYWTPIGNSNKVNALKSACRDDDLLAKSSICKLYK